MDKPIKATAKEYLKQYRWLDKAIRDEKERLFHYRRLAESPPNTMKREPGGTTQGDRLSHYVARAADLAVLIDRRVIRLMKLKAEITGIIDRVEEPLLNMVLKKYYIDLMNWSDIAEELGYAREYVWKLHGRALQKVDGAL